MNRACGVHPLRLCFRFGDTTVVAVAVRVSGSLGRTVVAVDHVYAGQLEARATGPRVGDRHRPVVCLGDGLKAENLGLESEIDILHTAKALSLTHNCRSR